jgi:hypothetical protein
MLRPHFTTLNVLTMLSIGGFALSRVAERQLLSAPSTEVEGALVSMADALLLLPVIAILGVAALTLLVANLIVTLRHTGDPRRKSDLYFVTLLAMLFVAVSVL